MIAGTMKSVAAAVYRSAVSNDQEENTEQEEDHDEEYVLNSSDDVGDISSDEEEEKSKRDVDEEEEEEEEGEEEEEVDEQKDDDDDDDDAEINSSETNVYLGHARHCYPGSQKYRKTLQRLAKKHGFDWSDRILSSLLKKHTPNAFKILDASSSRWRKASTNEIRSAAKSTISTYRAKHRAWARAYRAACGKKRKGYPKAASRRRTDDDDDDDEVICSGDEWDYDNYVSDQDKKPSVTKDKKPSATKQKAAKAQSKRSTHDKKRPHHETRRPGSSKGKIDKLTETYVLELRKLKELVSLSDDLEVYGERRKILDFVKHVEKGRTKYGI